jgi:hypothetical protein
MITVDAYGLFLRGLDTLEIANLTQRSESHVLKEINIRRSKKLGRDIPYRGVYPKPSFDEAREGVHG